MTQLRALLCLILPAILAVGCVSVPVDKRALARQEINLMAEEALAAFLEEDPSLQEAIDSSLGYMAGAGVSGILGTIGLAGLKAVLYDQEHGTRTYMNLDEVRLGLGFGSADLQVLAIVTEEKALERLKGGRWISKLDALSVAGENVNRAEMKLKGIDVYLRSKSGAAIGASVQVMRVGVNTDLTDTGVAALGIPVIDGKQPGEQGEDAPRVWRHKMPFLGQKVIDRGINLPLPYGVGFVYADVTQDMGLSNLSVGINGREKIDTPFVTFENSVSETESRQLKLDTWVLPFLNLYALLGKTEGFADMDVLIDGNHMLEELGTDCRGVAQSPLCDLLEDQIFVLPVTATLDLTTTGIGGTLAGAWKGWIGVLPFNIVHAEREGSVADGESLTITPRIGRLKNLGNFGNLAMFVGGNYLKSEYTIEGNFTPIEELSLDYTVDQINIDRWNLLVGFNWDITKQFSWSAEYNGFIGSREAFITSVTLRF